MKYQPGNIYLDSVIGGMAQYMQDVILETWPKLSKPCFLIYKRRMWFAPIDSLLD